MVAPCGIYKVEAKDGYFSVYPVIGIRLSHEALFTGLDCMADAEAAVASHALGAHFERVKLTPTVWLLERASNAAVRMPTRASATDKDKQPSTPTELIESSNTADDDNDDMEEIFDLFD